MEVSMNTATNSYIRCSGRLRRSQHGAVGIEFAIVFLVFFVVFYAIVSYAIAMLLQSAFIHAAEEGARAAIAVDRIDTNNYSAAVQTYAEEKALEALGWMSENLRTKITVETSMSSSLLSVKVAYMDYTSDPLVPILTLPVFGQVPNLPDDLAGTARINLY